MKDVFSTNLKMFFELTKIVSSEKKNIYILLVFSVFTSLLYLLVPISAQVIINTASTNVLVQPLILFTIGICIGLLFLGFLRTFQIFIAEIIQRKIFVEIALAMSRKISRIKQVNFDNRYPPEIINRFFDVTVIQKAFAEIIIDVPPALIQIIVGLVLMAIYSPILLFFDTALVISIFILFLLGHNGIQTSINESSSKYNVAYWLEEIARCQVAFKLNNHPSLLVRETDERLMDYLDNRKKHFQVVLRQLIMAFAIEGIGTAGVLAIGGWLVMIGSLNLGQLVAAEIVVILILSALDKIVGKLETWYDLATAVNKVNSILNMEIDHDREGEDFKREEKGARIVCEHLSFTYDDKRKIFDELDLVIEPGVRACLVGVSGAGKTTLAYLISGLIEDFDGNIFVNSKEILAISDRELRSNISLVSNQNEIFADTIENNIKLGRDYDDEHFEDVLNLLNLRDDFQRFENGMKTILISEGRNISLGQKQRILIARGLMSKPQILILDEAFSGMDERTKLNIVDNLYDKSHPWTIINITHDAELVSRSDMIYLLKDRKIVEHDTFKSLVSKKDSEFVKLFPFLFEQVEALRKRNG
jgi:ABC-type bacteriocin/lantibiotic exporter with double-glycine peptidase domain